jgi:hypothetical protein
VTSAAAMAFTRKIFDLEQSIQGTMAEITRVRIEHAEGKIKEDEYRALSSELLTKLQQLQAEKLRVALRRSLS